MQQTRNISSLILLASLLFSCGDFLRNKSEHFIKGKSEIVFRGIDKSLNGKTAISGYVYSKDMKEFVEQAYLKIGDKNFRTDKNGYFNAIIESGKHTVSTSYIGNTEEKITDLKVEQNTRTIIIFELGLIQFYVTKIIIIFANNSLWNKIRNNKVEKQNCRNLKIKSLKLKFENWNK